jgi:clathrin heavy chain
MFHKVSAYLSAQCHSSCTSYYKALSFYLQEQPPLLTDLLTVLIPRIDHSRVVRMFRQVDHIPLIRSYLIAVQHVSSLDIRWYTS